MAQMIWLGISLALAVVGSIVLYFTFLRKSNDQKFKGFLGWMYDFLSFKKLFLEDFLKVLYLGLTIFVILYSFAMIGQGFVTFLVSLIGGVIGLRVTFELTLVILMICRNTTNISNRVTNLEKHFVGEEVVEAAPVEPVKEEKKEEAK
ncbi:MAG: hypothetical protein IKI57_02985 [Clostridia bacterium]|nr:hypothetical protein [Clostridia bacterium]